MSCCLMPLFTEKGEPVTSALLICTFEFYVCFDAFGQIITPLPFYGVGLTYVSVPFNHKGAVNTC